MNLKYCVRIYILFVLLVYNVNILGQESSSISKVFIFLPNNLLPNNKLLQADSLHLLNSKTKQLWNSTQSSWFNDSLYQYNYNIQKLVDTMSTHKWTNGSVWSNEDRYIYNYNSYNKIVQRIGQEWHGGEWLLIGRHFYTYSGNNIYRENSQVWGDNNWFDAARKTYTLDSMNRINEIVSDYASLSCLCWCQYYKRIYFYTVENQISSEIGLETDYCNNNLWKNEKQNQYFYDGFGNMTKTIGYSWDKDSLTWKNNWQEFYTYNDGNKLETVLKVVFVDSEWINSTYRIISYDINDNWIEDATQIWNESNWINSFRYLAVYYEPLNISEEIPNINSFNLFNNYPNPFNPVTTVKFSIPKTSQIKIVVYDIIGKEIKTLINEEKSKGVFEVQFDASNLSSGVYIYQLTAFSENAVYNKSKQMILLK